jgi:hypothetical protein
MAIDTAIVAGVGYRTIAARFDVGRSSVTRHAKAHLTAAQRATLATAAQPLAIDADALAEREGSNLLSHVAAQRARLLARADAAAELGDHNASIAAERALTATLIVTGRLVGQFTTKIDVRHSHVLLSEDWILLRRDLMTALRAHPAAMRAVVAVVQARESAAARQINPPEPITIEPVRKAPPAPPLIEHETTPVPADAPAAPALPGPPY